MDYSKQRIPLYPSKPELDTIGIISLENMVNLSIKESKAQIFSLMNFNIPVTLIENTVETLTIRTRLRAVW